MNILIFNDDCKIFTEIIIILTLPFFLNIYIGPYLFNFYFNANLWNLAQWLYKYTGTKHCTFEAVGSWAP